MAPKKRKATSSVRPRTQRVIERDVLTDTLSTLKERCTSCSNTCGACLLDIAATAKVGVVDNCTHVFHYTCAAKWAETENTCPQCKQRFFWLAAYSSRGKRESLTRVQSKDQEAEEDDEFENVHVCEECKEVGDESMLMLCDGMHGTCNATYHTTCVGLTAIPRESWFCKDCVERGFDTDAKGRSGSKKWARREVDLADPEPEPPEVEETTATASSSSHSARPDPRAEVGGKAGGEEEMHARSPEPGPSPPPAARSRRSDAIPSQYRLNALACVSPAMDVPKFNGGGDSSAVGPGLFASFVQRRKAAKLQQQQASADPGASFIKLNPTYEEDFMGGARK